MKKIKTGFDILLSIGYRGTKVQIAGNTMHSFYGEEVK